MTIGNHKERAHSKFSASGSERWLHCAYSVEGEENIPDLPDSFWSKEGTLAHEVFEAIILGLPIPDNFDITDDMIAHVKKSAAKVRAIQRAFGGKVFAETRVYAAYIHPEMFGTLDVYIAGGNRTLHIFDFKYGAGHVVRAEKNTQLIQYALSVAESYGWEESFDTVVLHVLQPRVSESGHDRWSLTMKELKNYWLPMWEKGVKRIEKGGNKPFAGSWCHWCKKKFICPAKAEKRVTELTNKFSEPLTNNEQVGNNGVKEKGGKARKKESEEFKKAVRKGKVQIKEKGVKVKEESFY